MESTAFIWPLLLTASTTGLMGSLHCLGMCGGISATVALASPPTRARTSAAASAAGNGPTMQVALVSMPAPASAAGMRATAGSPESNVLAFNAGRLVSYALAGGLAGTIGGALAGLGQGWVISETMPLRTALFLFANLLIIFTGFYLMGVPQLLAPLERAGGHLWRHLSPWSRKLLPLRTPGHAALFGMLWGWIPCGMVYAMLLTAMSAGSAAGGALTMLAFGAGTLPAMVGAGWSAGRLRTWTRQPRVRLAAGLAVVALGIFGIARIGTLEQLQQFGAMCAAWLPFSGAHVAAP